MKKLLSLCLICLIAVLAMAQHAPASDGYVDLGLPSGTLWKNANEGGDDTRYSHKQAVSKFGDKLPTKEQCAELINKCTWTWIDNGFKVTGPNGQSITLPAAGYRFCYGDVGRVGTSGYYWSSTPDGSYAWCIDFDSTPVVRQSCLNRSTMEFSVRLVAASDCYVDLGLPSGTLWKRGNEGWDALYTYDEAVRKFGNKLPTKQQLEELRDMCTWTWTGNGYKVTGPNGESITLPAAGSRNSYGGVYKVGGHYWSTTGGNGDLRSYLFFDSGEVKVSYNDPCYRLSVRLVK